MFAAAAGGSTVAAAQSAGRVHAAMTPDDFLFVLQWNLGMDQGIRMPPAWDVGTGVGVRVAVLDTGVVTHPDLDANIVAGYDFIIDAANARDGNGRDADAADPGDWAGAGECGVGSAARSSSWHGTRVAGLIAAVTNNGADVAGIAHGARVVPVRVAGKCGTNLTDLADAITWSSGGTVSGVPSIASPVEVIALGVTGVGACDASLQAAIDGAVGRGVVVVAGAGDYNRDATQSWPGNCIHVTNVAAMTRIGARAPYSDYGPAVDLIAPGGSGGQFDFGYGIESLMTYGGTTPGDRNVNEARGTTLAMAHVAGIAAVMQGVKANAPAVVQDILEHTALPMPLPCPEGCGAGLVDASMAVRAAAQPMVFVTPPTDVVEGEAGTHTVDFRVRLSQPLAVPLAFDIATVDGTAKRVEDYVPRTLTGQAIPAGQVEYTFPVAIKGDEVAEPDETFGVALANVVGAAVPVPQALATMHSDDCFVLASGVPITGLSGAKDSATCFTLEVLPYSTGSVVFTNTGGSSTDMYVSRNQMPDPRGGYWDYDSYSNTCSFNAGNAGTYYVLLRGRTAYSGVTLTGSFTPPPPPNLSVADASIVEEQAGTRDLKFTVQLSTANHADVKFDVATSDVSATAGSDYAAVFQPGYVIPAGVASHVFHVPVSGDTDIEADETLRFDVANVVGANVIDGSAIGTIVNDDGPLLRVGDVNIKEGDAGTKLATFTVSLNQPSTGAETFAIATRDAGATAGSDYVALDLAGETIPAGQFAKAYSVTINGDTTLEPNEMIRLDLRATSGASVIGGDGYIQILNDEGPTLSVLDASVREGNDGRTQMIVRIRLSQAANVDVAYQLAVLPGSADSQDLESPGLFYGYLSPGQTSDAKVIYVLGDRTIEPDETVNLELRNVTGVTAYDWRGVVTILNDDGPGLYVRNAAVTEGNDGTRLATFEVTLSQALPDPISYSITTANGSAQAGSDYQARTLVGETIPAGMLSRTFTVPVIGDTVTEGTEVFSARLFDVGPGASAWTPVGTGYIINDDGPALSVLDASVVEGEYGTQTMSVTVRLSEPAPGPVTYSISTAPGTARPFFDDYGDLSLADQVIPAGETTRTHAITVYGDPYREGNETILVNLGPVQGATRYDWQAVGTIVNDDGPTLSVDDAVIAEGNNGTKVATFNVRLSQASSVGVAYDIATSDLTATAGADYVASPPVRQQIPAGQLAKTFTVTINGDTATEANETFRVTLSNPSAEATLFKYIGTGTITNDD
jgi:serine protease